MKPLERIKEIAKDIAKQENRNWGTPTDNDYVKAILIYQDEEKIRVNDVLHAIVGAMHDGAFDTQNCNYLHQMIDEKLKE